MATFAERVDYSIQIQECIFQNNLH